jgi:hypothetical protein
VDDRLGQLRQLDAWELTCGPCSRSGRVPDGRNGVVSVSVALFHHHTAKRSP